MRNLNPTEHAIMAMLTIVGTITIRDMVEEGLERGRPLKEALMDLEADGIIEPRLPTPNTPLRLYGLPTDDWVWPEVTPMPGYLKA